MTLEPSRFTISVFGGRRFKLAGYLGLRLLVFPNLGLDQWVIA